MVFTCVLRVLCAPRWVWMWKGVVAAIAAMGLAAAEADEVVEAVGVGFTILIETL